MTTTTLAAAPAGDACRRRPLIVGVVGGGAPVCLPLLPPGLHATADLGADVTAARVPCGHGPPSLAGRHATSEGGWARRDRGDKERLFPLVGSGGSRTRGLLMVDGLGLLVRLFGFRKKGEEGPSLPLLEEPPLSDKCRSIHTLEIHHSSNLSICRDDYEPVKRRVGARARPKRDGGNRRSGDAMHAQDFYLRLYIGRSPNHTTSHWTEFIEFELAGDGEVRARKRAARRAPPTLTPTSMSTLSTIARARPKKTSAERPSHSPTPFFPLPHQQQQQQPTPAPSSATPTRAPTAARPPSASAPTSPPPCWRRWRGWSSRPG